MQEVENCGFMTWLDPEWPQPLKNALAKLWTMYNDTSSARLDEMIEHGKVIKQVAEEKRKVDQKYASLMDDVQKFMDRTERDVMEKNYAKYNDEKRKSINEEKLQAVNVGLEEEVKKLKAELAILQDSKKHDEEMVVLRRKNLEKEKEILKEEKKKLEYTLHDLFQQFGANKEKLKMIKQICADVE
jgi:hypothetical protein